MEFLGVGYQEVLLILVLTLVVVGPERMPAVAYQIGKAVRQLQRYARAVRDEFSDEIGYIEEQYRTVKGEVDTARGAIREESSRLAKEMREAAPPIERLPEAATNIIPFNAPVASAPGAGLSDTGDVPAPGVEPPKAAPGVPLVF